MNGVIEIRSNDSRFLGQKPDPVTKLLERMETYKLDPERNWITTETHLGRRHYYGIFVNLSAVYHVVVKLGSEADKKLAAAPKHNKKLPNTN